LGAQIYERKTKKQEMLHHQKTNLKALILIDYHHIPAIGQIEI